MANRKPRKKRSPETPESKAFRREMEHATRRERDARLLAEAATHWLTRGVYIQKDGDPDKIAELCSYGGCWIEGALVALMIRPNINVQHYAEFDRALCAAGLKAFVRPCHPTDDAVGAKAMLVQEIEPGVRARRMIRFGETEPV
jgi:hypothetical protein